MKITLDGLRVLDAIARKGSFAAAAAELHRVTSALSYSVHKMETDLGFRLFEREGKKSVLTDAGRSLLNDGRRLLQAAERTELRAQRVAAGWELELHIALDTLLSMETLNRVIGEFDALACGTELTVHEEVLGGCWDALNSGRCDLAIGAAGDVPAGGRFRLHPLATTEMVFAVAPDHELAGLPQPVSEAVIETYRAVVIADSSRRLLPRTSNILEDQSRLVVPDLAAKLSCQAAGLGVGAVPRRHAERLQQQGRLVILELEVPPEPVEHRLAWRGDHVGKAMQWFIDRLQHDGLDWTLP